jgi:hypothetical protein
MNKYIKIGVMCFAIFYSVFSFADTANVNANNQATVAVTDRSGPALQLALRSAFSQVMIQMSNNPAVMTIPAVQKASTNVTPWVQSYGYVEQPNANNPQASPTLMLQVVFDQAGLAQLLKTTAPTTAQSQQSPTTQSSVMMLVTGVRNIADYMQVMRTLRDKSDVMQVTVSGMQSDHVLLRVKLVGNSADFQKVLASDHQFKAVMDGAQSKQLEYYWMGNQA